MATDMRSNVQELRSEPQPAIERLASLGPVRLAATAALNESKPSANCKAAQRRGSAASHEEGVYRPARRQAA